MLQRLLNLDVRVGKRKLDTRSLFLFGVTTFIWVVLWVGMGLYTVPYVAMHVIFYAMFGVVFLNGFYSDDTAANYATENAVLRNIEVVLGIIATGALGFGILVQQTLLNRVKVDTHLVNCLLALAFISAFAGLLYISLPKEGRYIRYYRKTKQMCLNFSIAFLIMAIIVITNVAPYHG